MKKYIYLIICLLVAVTILAIPELNSQLCMANNADNLLAFAAGPAFAPLKWSIGKNNMGGFKSMLLFIPFDVPSKVPLLPAEVTSNEDLIKAAGSFEFATGGSYTKPIFLYSTEATVEYKAEPQGEPDGISYKQTASFFFPGNTPEMHAFNTLIKNTPGYLILEDTDGQQIMMGKPGMYPSISPSFSGGKAHGDRRGTTYTATCDANESAIFLAVPIDMEAVGGLKPEPTPSE